MNKVNTATFDVAIVGNGVLGLSTAFALSSKDSSLKIALIGPSQRTGAASVAAGAMLGCFGEITKATFHSKQSRLKFDLALRALRMWPDWIDKINAANNEEQPVSETRGTFIILNSKSGRIESENFATLLDTLDSIGETYEDVDASEIKGLSPSQDYRPLRSIYLPNEGCMESGRWLNALQRALAAKPQVHFIDAPLESLHVDPESRRPLLMLPSGERIVSPKVVLAAGVYTQTLIDQIPELRNAIPRIFSGVGTSLTLSQNAANPIHQVIRTPNRAGACGLHVLPTQTDTLYIGASNDVAISPESQTTAGIMHFLLECAIEQINTDLYRSTLLGSRTGNRPVPADSFPLVGPTSVEGLWILTGTYRDGFHQSPLWATEIASVLLGGDFSFDNLFVPERAPIKTYTREKAIQIYLDHHMAGFYEHGFKLPKIASESAFEMMLREKIERVYDGIGSDFGISPDILLMFELESAPLRSQAILKREYGCDKLAVC